MTAAYFEDHPTDPDKMIMRKPHLDIEGPLHVVCRCPACKAQPQRTWVGLTDEEIEQGCKESWVTEQAFQSAVWWAEAKLKEKNT